MKDGNAPLSLDTEVSFPDLVLSLRRFRTTIRRERQLLAAPVLFALCVGVFLGFGSDKEYSSSAKIVPYRSNTGSQGGIAGLAGLAGVRIPSGMAGDFVIGSDIYSDVVRTLDFTNAIAETPIQFNGLVEPVSSLKYFAEIHDPAPVEVLQRYTLGLPGLLADGMRPESEVVGAPSADSLIGLRVVDATRMKFLREIDERITVSVDKRTGVVTIEARMPDPVAAASLVKATADRLTRVVMEFEIRKADEQLVYINEQYEVARERYDIAQRRLATFADKNRALMSATAEIERDRLEREASVAFETFQQIAREREQVRIKRSQDTPVFAVLDIPAVPTERSSPKRGQILLLSMVLGLLAGIARIAMRSGLANDLAQRTGPL